MVERIRNASHIVVDLDEVLSEVHFNKFICFSTPTIEYEVVMVLCILEQVLQSREFSIYLIKLAFQHLFRNDRFKLEKKS